jgi:N-acetylglucosaminyldiphosphoundecaprenol N-acetyl-beta-D-mannosaminyltransferase
VTNIVQDRVEHKPAIISTDSRYVLGVRVDATSYPDAARHVLEWARRGDSRYVCVTSMHGVMEAYDSSQFRQCVNGADLVTPDGMPLVWGLRLLGIRHATRVYGPDLTPYLLSRAAAERIPVGFYGGTPAVLSRLQAVLAHRFPDLRVAFSKSPPFRPSTPEEDRADVDEINRSEVRILFIGLGVPKQERWMAEHVSKIQAVMVGVGAALDFLAGVKPQAPPWMQKSGLEWCFRLGTEPRRLWRRYLKHGPRFIGLFGLQLCRCKSLLHRRP